MKRTLSLLLLLCMFVSLLPGAAFAVEETAADALVVTEAAAAEEASAAEAETAAKESNLKTVFNSRLYVEKNKAAGLDGRVDVQLDLLGATGTLYLPGKADASQLCFAWDAEGVTVTKDGVAYSIDKNVLENEIVPAVEAIAEHYRLQTVDLRPVFEGRPDLFSDGCHPTKEGAALFAQEVAKAILGE